MRIYRKKGIVDDTESIYHMHLALSVSVSVSEGESKPYPNNIFFAGAGDGEVVATGTPASISYIS